MSYIGNVGICSSSSIDVNAQIEIKIGNFLAEKFKYYFVEAGTGIVNITLPSNPENGDWVKIFNKESAKIIVLFDGTNTIYDNAGNFEVDIDNANLEFTFNNGNWEISDNSIAASLVNNTQTIPVSAGSNQIEIKSSSFVAERFKYYFVEAETQLVVTMTLPTTPQNGDWVKVFNKQSAKIDVLFDGTNTIYDNTGNFEIDTDNANIELVFNNGNWEVFDNSFVGNLVTNSGNVTLNLDTVIVNSNFTANKFIYYYVNTSSGPISMNLPINPSNGDWFMISDSNSTFDSNPLTIQNNGTYTINRSVDNLEINVENSKLKFVYINGNWDILDLSII